MSEDRRSEEAMMGTLEMVAPGTELRDGLEHIVSAHTGALITLGDVEHVLELCNGGFELDCEFSGQRLFELAKMDGAIILDDGAERILRANVHLVPDPSLPTGETGMRHRTAERVARQTRAFVISISQKRDIISLYLGDMKYALQDIRVLLAKANQALQTLEKYKIRLDEVSASLSALEFEDLVTLLDVVTVIQRSEMVQRVAREIERYSTELGTEGRLIRMQLDELVGNVEDQAIAILKDYSPDSRNAGEVKQRLAELSSEELLDSIEICRSLGYQEAVNILESPVHSRGYRLLSRVPRLPNPVVENIVDKFKDLQKVLRASIEELDAVSGVGEVRAKAIKDGLQRLKEYNILERYV